MVVKITIIRPNRDNKFICLFLQGVIGAEKVLSMQSYTTHMSFGVLSTLLSFDYKP